MTKMIAEDLKRKIQAIDPFLEMNIYRPGNIGHCLVATDVRFHRNTLGKILELIGDKSYYFQPSEVKKGQIDFVIN